MANKRRTLQPEFKAKAALAAIRGDKTVNEIAKDFAIHPVQINQWKTHVLSNAANLFAKGVLGRTLCQRKIPTILDLPIPSFFRFTLLA